MSISIIVFNATAKISMVGKSVCIFTRCIQIQHFYTIIIKSYDVDYVWFKPKKID